MSRPNTRTAQAAKEMRAAIKAAHGYRPSQVSVRIETYSMGSTIRVEVKDPSVDFHTIKRIAEGFAAGSMSVDVEYSAEARVAIGAPYMADVVRAIGELAPGDLGVGVMIGKTGVYMIRTGVCDLELAQAGEAGRAFWNQNGDTDGAIAFEVASLLGVA